MARLPWLGAIAAIVASTPALAQSGSDVATAQVLFDDAKRLMDQKRFADACPKLVESQRLDPGGGTLIVLGLCHEGEGKVATAWGDFNLALAAARKDHRADREKAAQDHIAALAPRLPYVTVIVDAKTDGLEVSRDGQRESDALLGTAVPLDPGDHVFAAKAPGKKEWTSKVTAKEGAKIEVRVPALTDAPAPPPPPPAPPPIATTPAPPASPAPSATSSSNDRLPWVLVAAGVGVVGVTVGTISGLRATAQWHDAQNACPGGKCANASDAQVGHDAGRTADVSTVSFVVGGVAIAAAAVIWLWPRDAQDKSGVRVAPMIGRTNGIAIGGEL